MNNGDIVSVPGSSVFDSGSTVTINTYGQLGVSLPANVYPGTLSITDNTGQAYRIAPGMVSPPYNATNGYMMIPEFPQAGPITLAPYADPAVPPVFDVAYQTGP